MYLRELSGSKFHSVILYNDVKTQFLPKVDLSGFGKNSSIVSLDPGLVNGYPVGIYSFECS